jgi:hypothetical protein
MDKLRRSSTVINDGDLGAIPDYYAAYPLQTTQAGCSASAFWQEENERTMRYALRDTSADLALDDSHAQYSGSFSRAALNVRYSGTGNRSDCVPDMPEEFFGQMAAEDYHDNQYKTKRDYTASRYAAFGVKPTDSTIGDMETGPNADNYILEPAYRRMQERRIHDVDQTMVNEAPKIWIAQKGARHDPDGDASLSYNEAYNREAYSPIIRKHIGDWALRTVLDHRLSDEWYSQQRSVRVLDRARVMNQDVSTIDHTFFNRGATATTLRGVNRNDAQMSERDREHAYENAIRALAVKKTTQHNIIDTTPNTIQTTAKPAAALMRTKNVNMADTIYSGAAAEVHAAPSAAYMYNPPTNLSDIIRTYATEEISQQATKIDKYGRPVNLSDIITNTPETGPDVHPKAAGQFARPVNLSDAVANTPDADPAVQPKAVEPFARPVNLSDAVVVVVSEDDEFVHRTGCERANTGHLLDGIVTIVDEDQPQQPGEQYQYDRHTNALDGIVTVVNEDDELHPNMPPRSNTRVANLSEAFATQELPELAGKHTHVGASRLSKDANGNYVYNQTYSDNIHSFAVPEVQSSGRVRVTTTETLRQTDTIDQNMESAVMVMRESLGMPRKFQSLAQHSEKSADAAIVAPTSGRAIRDIITRTTTTVGAPQDTTMFAPAGSKKVRFTDTLTATLIDSQPDTTLQQQPAVLDAKSLYNTQQLAVVDTTGHSLYNMHLTNSVEKLNNIVPTIVDVHADGQAMNDIRGYARAIRVSTAAPQTTAGDNISSDDVNYDYKPASANVAPAQLRSHAEADGALTESDMGRVSVHGLRNRRMRLAATTDDESVE